MTENGSFVGVLSTYELGKKQSVGPDGYQGRHGRQIWSDDANNINFERGTLARRRRHCHETSNLRRRLSE